jgi:hypothetical protein
MVKCRTLDVASVAFFDIWPEESRIQDSEGGSRKAVKIRVNSRKARVPFAPVTWFNLTNFLTTNSPVSFMDHSATNRMRFYRVTSP